LVVQHEKQKLRGKQLAAQNPMTKERIAKMLWAKNHKNLIEQFKISIGVVPKVTYKIVNGKAKTKTQFKLTEDQQYQYSVWLTREINSDPNFRNYYLQIAQGGQNNITQNLNYFIDWLQQQTPPRCLTGVMKTYIKESLKLGASEQQIFEYIISLADKVPVRILDPVTRKIVQKTAIFISSPNGVQ